MVKKVLRFEGLFVLLLSLYVYSTQGFSWLTFGLLLLTPDLAMIGYLLNKKAGAIIYNTVHTYIFAIVVYAAGQLLSENGLVLYGLIMFAHIGMDRMLGYGLKYVSSFKDTHLGRIS